MSYCDTKTQKTYSKMLGMYLLGDTNEQFSPSSTIWLLYRLMHNLFIFQPKSLIFGEHVPKKYVYICMWSHLLF